MSESRRARRERERWQREMVRRLEELDRLDRAHGLGTYPAPGGPKHRRPGPAMMPEGAAIDGRRAHGALVPGLIIVLIIVVVVMLRSPGATGDRIQQLVDGLTGHHGSYKFVNETANSRPFAWDPCRTIHYVVNPDGAPPDWKDTVGDAVDEVTEASGFEFAYDGTTSDRHFEDRLDGASSETPPVLIAWSDPSEVSELEGRTAGIGGATPRRVDGRFRYVTGLVVLDAEAYDEMDRTGRTQAERLIIAHELGHVLGLDHVKDTGELMNAEYVGQRGFGYGDKAGFKILHQQPCG